MECPRLGYQANQVDAARQRSSLIDRTDFVIERNLVMELLRQFVISLVQFIDLFPRFFVPAQLMVNQSQIVIRMDHARIFLESDFNFLSGVFQKVELGERQAAEIPEVGIVITHLQRFLEGEKGLLVAVDPAEGHSQIGLRYGIVGFFLQGFFEFQNRSIPISLLA